LPIAILGTTKATKINEYSSMQQVFTGSGGASRVEGWVGLTLKFGPTHILSIEKLGKMRKAQHKLGLPQPSKMGWIRHYSPGAANLLKSRRKIYKTFMQHERPLLQHLTEIFAALKQLMQHAANFFLQCLTRAFVANTHQFASCQNDVWSIRIQKLLTLCSSSALVGSTLAVTNLTL
jgi:hypothetical protein